MGPERDVPAPRGAESFHFPESVILPGLVNAHTHLELSGIAAPIVESDFYAWLLKIRSFKESLSYQDFLAAAERGLKESWRHGVTTVADTGTSGAVLEALLRLGGRGIYYQEVIAPHPDQARAAMEELDRFVTEHWSRLSGGVRLGVSPHAPYTVSLELFSAAVGYARERSLRVASHVAESRAEVDLLVANRGPFAESRRLRGIPAPRPARSPVEWLWQLGVLHPGFLAIHAVQTDGADVRLLARSGCSVVVCPRSNAAHGHGAAPIRRYLEAGIPVALGTDSLASVRSLDLLAEAREAARLAGLRPGVLIRMLTLGGARVLGLDSEIGSLEPGKWADLCVVRIGGDAAGSEDRAASAVIEAGSEQIVATFVGGRRVHGPPV
ncbi:MAG: metal-dependent hydrolase [Gemmatimonadales bacterium]|nr:MAG: metal-dependent hydrolase [Gemmatimonadales bacterium]